MSNKKEIGRRDFLKIASLSTTLLIPRLYESSDGYKEELTPSELVESYFTVDERVKVNHGIQEIQLNSDFDRLSILTSEDSLASALIISFYETWKKTTGKGSNISLRQYSKMLSVADKTNDHSFITFGIAGADRSTGNNNINTVTVDPLKGVEIIAAEPIYEGFHMNLRVDKKYSRFKTNDLDLDRTGSAKEVYIDNAYYGFARNRTGGLQIMFNLGSKDFSNPASSKSITGRLETALTLLTFVHHGYNQDYEELGNRVSRNSIIYTPLLFTDKSQEIGVLASR